MKFVASEMGRVVKCPGSKQAEAKRPRTGTYEATEGTAAHELACICLRGQCSPDGYLGQEIKGIPVDAEMITHVGAYLEYLSGIYFRDGGIETKIGCSWAENELVGIPDFWSFDASKNILHIVDFKYGFGWVFARDNWQLIAGATILVTTGAYAKAAVHLHIFQPRANKPGGPGDVCPLTHQEFTDRQTQMARAMAVAGADNPTCGSGGHCRYCRAILECKANTNTAGHCLDVAAVGETGPLEPEDIAIQLSQLEVAAKRLTHRRVALEAHALELVRQGTPVPGYEARQAYGNLEWSVDAVTAGDEMGVDLAAPTVPITPTQAKDRGLISPEMLAFMAVRKPGAFKLKCVDMDAIRRIINVI